jgi:hypothetical protein
MTPENYSTPRQTSVPSKDRLAVRAGRTHEATGFLPNLDDFPSAMAQPLLAGSPFVVAWEEAKGNLRHRI